jgi:hypothetical protein
MTDHTPTPEAVLRHPEQIGGYAYGTSEATRSPLDPEDLAHLKEAVWLTADDELALRDAADILAGQVSRMHAAFTKSVMLHVTVWTRAYADPAMR